MNITDNRSSGSFPSLVWVGLLLFCLLSLAPGGAQAQSYLMPDNDDFADIIKHLSANQVDDAELALDALPANAKTADYHYLRGVLAMQAINDAGAFRMARLARRMKGHFEDALEKDPDHELAHFGLMQFHRFAPGLMGGRERELQHHEQRLIELNSFLQFPAALVRAQVEEDTDAQREIFTQWIAHSPQMFDAHYAYLSSLISWGDYTQANSAITEAFHHTDEEQVKLVQYQQVRMAALAGLSDDSEAASRHIQQSWFTEAYTTGLTLLDSDPDTQLIDLEWLNMRLAQIEWALEDPQSAHTRVNILLAAQPEERLQGEAIALQARINGD